MRRALPLLVLAALVAALAMPQTAAAADAPDQVVISGDVDVARGETVGDVVVVDGRIDVAGRIDGDVVAVSGPVRIAGTVDGTITAVSDRVTLLPGSHVTGDLIYGDERPVIARSASVDGKISDEGWAELDGFPWGVVGALSWWLAVSISTLALGVIAVALAPRAAEAVAATARDQLGVSIAVGFGLLVALPVLAVLALISLVGVPLGLGLLLALVPLGGLAYVAGAYVLGRGLVKSPASGFVAFLVGWALLRALALLPLVGVLVWVAAVIVGLGALVVAMWRSRAEERPEAPAPPLRVPETV
jgi:hypothetical protein